VDGGPVRLSLCGDVMLGRGVDQILPYPGDPTLREVYVRDAGKYVDMAERVNGPIDRPVEFAWPWGDALAVMDEFGPDVRVMNLETSVTRSGQFAAGKGVHYRMNPANLPCLTLARPDVCVLANNHVLDFGRTGLAETLEVLSGAGLTTAGAGLDLDQARRPAVITPEGDARVLVFAVGSATSGVPPDWSATHGRAGIDFISAATDAAADELIGRIQQVKRRGDVVVVSLHWGSNWGYHVSRNEIRFAHRLIDGGVDVVYGHSSHHPRPVEVYRGKLVLYGCGDFIDDYEGIAGYEAYRDDLRLLYLGSVEPDTGQLEELTMIPMQARQLQLHHASSDDAEWIRATLDRVSCEFGSQVDRDPDGMLTLRIA
jgi:poly-gamma-glutamate synthesis protein (capsule biosynthesis protein)